MQYKALFVAPNRVQLGLAVAWVNISLQGVSLAKTAPCVAISQSAVLLFIFSYALNIVWSNLVYIVVKPV